MIHRSFLVMAAIALASSSFAASVTYDFNTDQSASFTQVEFAGPDSSVDFSYDYSTHVQDDFLDTGTTVTAIQVPITSAPNGTGTTGVRIDVNQSLGAANSLTLYPDVTGLDLADGEWTMTFDVWANHNGNSGGASGSTEFWGFGAQDDTSAPGIGSDGDDGFNYYITGDGGSGTDYRYAAGTPPTSDNAGPNWLGVDVRNNLNAEWQAFFTNDGATSGAVSAGSSGKQWITVTLNVRNGGSTREVLFQKDGDPSATLVSTINGGAGAFAQPAIGYADFFSSLANPADDNFVVFDNLTIDDLGSATTVTVNASGGADFTSLQAAFESFTPGGSNAGVPGQNTILIDATGGHIDEVLQIDDDTSSPSEDLRVVGINGRAVVRPQLTTTSSSDAFEIDTDANLHFENLAFIPPTTNAAADDLLHISEEAAGGNTIRFEDCIFTSADASGEPLITSKNDALSSDTANIALAPGDDFITPFGGGWNLEVVDCVFSHGNQGAGKDGIVEVMGPALSGPTLYVESTVFSYLGRYGIQLSGDGDPTDPANAQYTVTGTADDPTIFLNMDRAFQSFLGPDDGLLDIDNTIIQDTSIAIGLDPDIALNSIDNSIIATNDVGVLYTTNFDFTTTATNVTLFDNTETFLIDPAATTATTQTINVTDANISDDGEFDDLLATNLGGAADGGAWAINVDSSTFGTLTEAIAGTGPTGYVSTSNDTYASFNYAQTDNPAFLGSYFATTSGDGASFSGPLAVQLWEQYAD